MNKHFTVTIHNEDGVKQFNVHHIVKKALLYAASFILALIVMAMGTILYLSDSIDKVQNKREGIEASYKEIEKQNKALENNMKKTSAVLEKKKKKIEALSDSLSEIEILIGLKPLSDRPLEERVNETKLTSQHRALLMQLIPSGSPIKYRGITSKFGYRIHPTLNRKEFHRGTDMKAPLNTPVYAPADAIVEWAGYHKRSGFGRLVILDHAYGFKSYFGHLNKVVIKSGKFVKKGDLIAYTGNSGMSNGPHLHYEIRFMHRVLNPFWFIKWTAQNYNEIFQKEKKVPWQSLITATSHLRVVQATQVQQSLLKEPK